MNDELTRTIITLALLGLGAWVGFDLLSKGDSNGSVVIWLTLILVQLRADR